MAESIIQKDKEHCFICGRHKNADYWGLDCHHVYAGANRDLSEKYGLKVYICHDKCHLNGVHKNREIREQLQSIVQEIAMRKYGWTVEDFRAIFGKNYLLNGSESDAD